MKILTLMCLVLGGCATQRDFNREKQQRHDSDVYHASLFERQNAINLEQRGNNINQLQDIISLRETVLEQSKIIDKVLDVLEKGVKTDIELFKKIETILRGTK